MTAGAARGHFPLQILQKTIREMILIGGATCRFHPWFTAIGARIFKCVFLRIAADCSPPCITNANSFFRRKTHDLYTSPKKETDYLMHEDMKVVHEMLVNLNGATTMS